MCEQAQEQLGCVLCNPDPLPSLSTSAGEHRAMNPLPEDT